MRLCLCLPASVKLDVLILPPALETGWRQFCVSDCVLDVLVPQVRLERSRIPPRVRLVEAASVPQHVRVGFDFESGGQSLAPALWRSLHWRCHVLSALLHRSSTTADTSHEHRADFARDIVPDCGADRRGEVADRESGPPHQEVRDPPHLRPLGGVPFPVARRASAFRRALSSTG